MSNEDDKLKSLLDFGEEKSSFSKSDSEFTKKVIARAKRQQSGKDFIEFGFVKLWTVLLEFFSIFYAKSSREKQVESMKRAKKE